MTTSPIGEIDISALEQLLARIRPAVEVQDYALLERVVGSWLGLIAEVRKRETTIARLRHLLGISGSEKTARVLGREGQDGGAPTPPTSEHSPADADKPSESNGGTQGGPDKDGSENQPPNSPPPAPKPKPARKTSAKGHGRLPASAYPHACHVAVPHESLKPGDVCPQCQRGRLYELVPAHWLRITGQPPLSAVCWDCQRLRCCPCGAVFTAQAPAEAQGDKYTDSAAALIALMRYRAGMPHNRLEQLQQDMETPVPASTQFEVVKERAEDLRPIHKELKQQAAQGVLFHNDDTHARILEFMGRRRAALVENGRLPGPERVGLFTTNVLSVLGDGHKIALFFTGRKHAGENLADLLTLRASGLKPPMQMSDALSWNPPKGHSVIDSHCLSHGRRQFVGEVTNHPEECRHFLELLEHVFAVDELSRRYQLSDEQRLRLHQRQSGPVMSELEIWLRAQFEHKRVEPNSGLGGAIKYMLKRWSTFTVFLRRPGAPLDNNICERALKFAIRHRNNSLFYWTQAGAEVGDLYMALIHTAEINGENSFAYLVALLRHAQEVAKSPADWLPWNYRAALARLVQRGAFRGPPPAGQATEAA